MLPAAQAEVEARNGATRALALDPLSAEAHLIMAAIDLFFDWNWPATEREIRTALDLGPSCEAHGLFAHYALARGWCEQAIAAQRRALDLDPMSATMNVDLIWTYLLSGDYARALELGLSSEYMRFIYPLKNIYLGQAYLHTGEYGKGVEQIEKVVLPLKEPPGSYLAMLGYAYGVARKRNDARQILSRMEDLASRRYVASYDWAVLHAGLGDNDTVLRRLTRAVEEREPRVIWLKVEPSFEKVRGDDRFQALVHRLALD